MGHSTRPLDELIGLLRHHHVAVLVDVRTVPASRRMPHFAKAALERSLPEHGIRYLHLPELGGLRKPKPDSINTGWRNVSFRGYADYMQTNAFWRGLDRLLAFSPSGQPHRQASPATSPQAPESSHVAVMCAEAVPWRCHRSLIADALTVQGVEVRHITSGSDPAPHTLTPFAELRNGGIAYPPPDTLGL